MLKLNFSLVIFFIFFTLNSLAIVDMKNANFADTWVDLDIPSTGMPLKITRTYNSRSLFNQNFGYGWCSEFETFIDITLEGNLSLTECGGGLEIEYFPQSFDQKNINNTITQIIKRKKSQNRKASSQYLNNLADKLRNDNQMREQVAKEVGIRRGKNKTGTVYKANGKENEQIVFDGTYYVRKKLDGTIQKFNNRGKLAFIYNKNKQFLKFQYNKGLLSAIDNGHKKIGFSYYPNKKIRTISSDKKVIVSYKYKNEDLVAVRNAWNNTYTYAYDNLHNLTRINFPDKTFKKITYNPRKDWVTSFQNRDKCIEKYSYIMSKHNPKNEYKSEATKYCNGKVVHKSSHEFWYKTARSGANYLYRVRTRNNNNSLDIVYHEVFGKPLSVKKNGSITSIAYYDDGLIKQKTKNDRRTDFKYKNQFKKVSEAKIAFLNKKGKTIKQSKTIFKYDNKGNLSLATNSNGQKVKLGYDVRGRMSSLIDQTRKVVSIKYDEATGKPSIISRPNVGTIRIKYKANGEIRDIKSKQGPLVASQVATTFNSLLAVISPATDELSL